MAQHDMNIANQGFPAFRSDLNDALAALVSTSSGATAPTTTFANQLWYDTTADTLKIRDESNAAWISVLTLNQTTDTVGQFLGNASDSATVPSFSWGSDPNTGMYTPGADQLAFTTGGTERLTLTTAQFTATLPWRGQAGTAAAPALSFSGDTNTGIYQPTADNIAISTAGAEAVRVDASGNVGIGTTPTSKFDVKGTIRLSGATSGYVGLAPAAAAGSTTYTLPAADGTSGQMLSTNGSGALSWETAGGGFANMQVFTSSGTFTVPAGVTKVKVTVVGGGGAGGGVVNTGTRGGGGGGGGGASIKIVSGLTPGSTVSVTVGTGGTGVSNGNGNAGGTSSFGAHCSATGGAGGAANQNVGIDAWFTGTFSFVSASSGAGSGGDLNVSSPPGYVFVFGGNDGGTGDIANLRLTTCGGGDGPLGLGFGGSQRTGFGAGNAGSGYGSGGSGAYSSGVNLAGGAGAAGVVIVEY